MPSRGAHGLAVLLFSSAFAAKPPCSQRFQSTQIFNRLRSTNSDSWPSVSGPSSRIRIIPPNRKISFRVNSDQGAVVAGMGDDPSSGAIDVAEILEEGRKCARNNPQASLLAFQKVIQLPSDFVTIEQRQAAFWNIACIFLRFGDLTKAQQSLGNAVRLGLDLEKAKFDPDLLPLQGSTAKMEEELWKYARELTRASPAQDQPLRPELESVNEELDLAEGQDLRYSSIARRVAIVSIGSFALVAGLGALLFPGLQSPEPSADYYELE